MTVPSSNPLCVVPVHLRTLQDADALMRCLVSLSVTARQADVLVVEHGTAPAGLRDAVRLLCAEVGFVHDAHEDETFVGAANIGLTCAQLRGVDAVLLRPELEFERGWLETMRARSDTKGRAAAVVGACVVSPQRRLHSAGWQFSQLARCWVPRFEHAAADLPAAQQACLCPVSADLMLIRHATLETVGVLDETLTTGLEAVDLCLRVFATGAECVYEPAVLAVRLGPSTEVGLDTDAAKEAERRLACKWVSADLSPFVVEAL